MPLKEKQCSSVLIVHHSYVIIAFVLTLVNCIEMFVVESRRVYVLVISNHWIVELPWLLVVSCLLFSICIVYSVIIDVC